MIARAALPTFILAGVALVIWIGVRDPHRRHVGDQTLLVLRPGATIFAYVGFAMPDVLAGDHADLHLQRARA